MARRTGVQCKLVETYNEKDFQKAVTDAEAFTPSLESFVVALGLPRDAKLQKAVWLLSTSRGAQGKFRVGVSFWDDITNDLALNPAQLAGHFPQFFSGIPTPPQSPPSLQDDVARKRYDALREIWRLAQRVLPDPHPDLFWEDALDDTALNLEVHQPQIKDILDRFGADLPKAAADALSSARDAATEGQFDLALFAESGSIPGDAAAAAETMYRSLQKAEQILREALQNDQGLTL